MEKECPSSEPSITVSFRSSRSRLVVLAAEDVVYEELVYFVIPSEARNLSSV
jgi:hypothetical protein